MGHGYLVKISDESDGNFSSYRQSREASPTLQADWKRPGRRRNGRRDQGDPCPITVGTKIGQKGIDLGQPYLYECERRLNDHSSSFHPKSFLGESSPIRTQLC